MKKFMITVIALALLATAAVPAFADDEDNTKSGEAGIEFEEGEAPGIVPPGPSTPDISTPSLNFGTRKLSAETEIYHSTDADVGIADEDRYAGIVVANSNKIYDWEVNVSIGDFTVGNQVTLKDYELTLKLEKVQGDYPVAPVVSDEIVLSSGSSDKVMTPAAGASAGTFGANYSGHLEVAGGTADQGEATATMVWAFQLV